MRLVTVHEPALPRLAWYAYPDVFEASRGPTLPVADARTFRLAVAWVHVSDNARRSLSAEGFVLEGSYALTPELIHVGGGGPVTLGSQAPGMEAHPCRGNRRHRHDRPYRPRRDCDVGAGELLLERPRRGEAHTMLAVLDLAHGPDNHESSSITRTADRRRARERTTPGQSLEAPMGPTNRAYCPIPPVALGRATPEEDRPYREPYSPVG